MAAKFPKREFRRAETAHNAAQRRNQPGTTKQRWVEARRKKRSSLTLALGHVSTQEPDSNSSETVARSDPGAGFGRLFTP
jgi:hypothetical protein